VYLNSKLDPIKFTVNWYLKGLIGIRSISLLPKKAFMMLSLQNIADIGMIVDTTN
jgi:hypothetical protein